MVNLTNIGGWEGGAFHQISLARQFRRSGIQVRMIAPRRKVADSVPADIREICCFSPSVERLGLPLSLDGIFQIPYLLWARVWEGYRLLYVRYNLLSIILACLGRLMGMRVVVEHNSWGAGERMNRGGNRFTSQLESVSQIGVSHLAHCSRCVSKGLADLLASRGVPREKIFVIGNGTDIKAFHPMDRNEACRRLHMDPKTLRIGFVGILAPWQGCETAIEALVHLPRIPNLELVIGGDGQERRKLEMLAKQLGVSNQVRFLGAVPRKKINALINCFDIAIAPFTIARNAEIGLSPIKIRDYAAAARPTAASAIPGINELAGEGWLFTHQPEDPKDLAHLLEQMLSLDFDLAASGLAARTYAEKNFDWSVVAKQVVGLF